MDSLPLLTIESVTQMATFWTRFLQEPDSIRTTARRAHLRKVVVPVGTPPPSIVMVDMPALAARYPAVAADLQAVGLTAQQHEAYRIAFASAEVFLVNEQEVLWLEKNRPTSAGATRGAAMLQALLGSMPAISAMMKNVVFLREHPDEFLAFYAVGMGNTP